MKIMTQAVLLLSLLTLSSGAIASDVGPDIPRWGYRVTCEYGNLNGPIIWERQASDYDEALSLARYCCEREYHAKKTNIYYRGQRIEWIRCRR